MNRKAITWTLVGVAAIGIGAAAGVGAILGVTSVALLASAVATWRSIAARKSS